MSLEETLNQVCSRLGLKLPPEPKPVGFYQPLILTGGFAFLSGQISRDAEGKLMVGRIGKDLNLEDGKKAARLALLQAMSLLRSKVGLDRVDQISRLTGFVQSAEDFYSHSEITNAASELLLEIFGERGKHARTTIGVASLPLNAAVEIELTVRTK